jgi:polycystin 2
MLDRLNVKRDRVIEIQNALKHADVNKDGVIEFDEWRRELKTRGYTDVEIENVFSRYDTDGDRVLGDAEQRRFKDDLAAQENNLEMDIQGLKASQAAQKKKSVIAPAPGSNGNSGNDTDNFNRITYDEFAILVRRIDRMEYSIGNIVSRIDGVLTKLEALEKGKMKRREALTRVLNSISEDNQMSKEVKQERLEKMIREELEENISDRQTPVQSLLPTTTTTTPGAPGGRNSNPFDKSSPSVSPTNLGGSKY